ncbi:site-specific integrase [Bradyrhizobium sp. SZCCHNRI3052]|uniref:site-specific integrase n=1 Tax=Bradyrhizobium sp. SZCCHNRI3052 TaxID=3057295 RepID=UPI002916481A|nr:site-specific integrase [Bradyrhizobium sp. SZCCHNRI3052]
MSRPSKGIRLYKRKARYRDGKLVHQAVWIIKDGDRHIATGCVASPTETKPPREAEQALADYIAEKYQPERRRQDIEDIDCADVLSIYLTDIGEPSDQFEIGARIDRLNEFWGGKRLSAVNAQTCAAYVRHRGNRGGARRDLETFRAAINHHAKEGFHRGLVRVSLPPKGVPRDRWLTRQEAAALIWHCWRHREKQTIHSGASKGDPVSTNRRPLRHVARFILIGLYTGTRAGAIASASPYTERDRSYVDLEHGIFYRKPIGKRATKKRQTPAPIPPRLLAHLRRWKDRKLIATCFVEFNGKPVASVKKGFSRAVGLAGLPGKVTPHTLRHTAATWLMQRGVSIWEAAGFLGMSPEILQDTYGHHHPDYLQGAAVAIGQKGFNVSVAKTVASPIEDRTQERNSGKKWSERQDSNLRPLRPEHRAPPIHH